MTTNEPKTPGYEFLAAELMKRDAEIERLRAVLQKIADLQAQSYACEAIDVARAALEPMP